MIGAGSQNCYVPGEQGRMHYRRPVRLPLLTPIDSTAPQQKCAPEGEPTRPSALDALYEVNNNRHIKA